MNKRHIIFITIEVTRFLESIADALFRNGKSVFIQAGYINGIAVCPVYSTFGKNRIYQNSNLHSDEECMFKSCLYEQLYSIIY